MRPCLLPLFALVLTVLLTAGSTSTWAQQGGDEAMRASLNAFFADGIEHQGATAELKQVIRWPDATGRIAWRMPHLNNHPERISLVAEQRRGNRLQRWYVPVNVHWWTKALVATRELPARSHLDASAVELARVDVANLNGRWWQNPAALTGTRNTRPLHKGQPVLSSYITRPALLRYGDSVTLISRIGGVQVSATGKVLRSAGIGDRIRVQNMRSKEVVQATILDAHTARVETGGAS